jgi:hypothetical protein
MAVTRYAGADNSSLAWSTIAPSSGDLILIVFTNDGGDNQTAPSPFTRLGTTNGTTVSHGLYGYVANGSESGTIFSSESAFGISGEAYCWHAFKIPAAEWYGGSLTYVEQTEAGGGGTTGTIDPASITPSWGAEADTLIIVSAGRDDDDGIAGLDSNYDTNFLRTASATGTGTCEMCSSWRTITATSEDPGTADQTNTNEEYITHTVAVRPPASGPHITDAGDEDFRDGETSVGITGINFGASQGSGKVELGDSATYGSANKQAQTVTAWGDTSITITVALGSLAPGTLYLYVTDDGSTVSNPYTVAVHRKVAFTLSGSSYIPASGEDATAQLTAPAGKTTGDFGGGRRSDDENPGDTVDLATDEYREDEWCIEATTDAIDSADYEFRVLYDGVAADTISVTPGVTVQASTSFTGSGSASISIATATGSGTLEFTGSGSASIAIATATGTGALEFTGSGSASIAIWTATGSGTWRYSGSGSASIAIWTATGTGVLEFTGSGSASISIATATGTGTLTLTFTGSGAASIAIWTATGAGVLEFTGSGSASIAIATATGAGVLEFTGSGSASISIATATGSGTITDAFVGSGAATVAASFASGSGRRSDNFNRADGGLGANYDDGAQTWVSGTPFTEPPLIASNQVGPGGSTAGVRAAWRTDLPDGGDGSYSVITLRAPGAGADRHIVGVRMASPSGGVRGYIAQAVFSDPTWAVYVSRLNDSSSPNSIGTIGGISLSEGDTLGIRVTGNGTIRIYKNGSALASFRDAQPSPYTDGYPGFGFHITTTETAALDDWVGGEVSGVLAFVGSGTATVPTSAATGSGTGSVAVPFVGSGATTVPTSFATGAGTGVLEFTGSGSASISIATATGAGVLEYVGSGSASIAIATATGSGTWRYLGSGSASIAIATATGSGILEFTGSGSASISIATATGTGVLEYVGSGSASIAIWTATGTGSTTSSLLGSGSATIAIWTATGAGTLEFAGSGSASVSLWTATGVANMYVFTGSGAASIAPWTATGVGIFYTPASPDLRGQGGGAAPFSRKWGEKLFEALFHFRGKGASVYHLSATATGAARTLPRITPVASASRPWVGVTAFGQGQTYFTVEYMRAERVRTRQAEDDHDVLETTLWFLGDFYD